MRSAAMLKPTADELSREQALTEGMHAGLMGRERSLNPYQAGSPEHGEWERGRQSAAASTVAGAFA